MNGSDLRALESLIERIADMSQMKERFQCTHAKVDALEHQLHEWRISRQAFHHVIEFEEYVRSRRFIDSDRIVFSSKGRNESIPPPFTQHEHQPTLLVHLLLADAQRFSVLDIIQQYIKWRSPRLSLLDYKITATGTIRCFTNTRFAANALRRWGLIRFTQDEAFKTWRLTVLGFVVASRLVESFDEVNLRRPSGASGVYLHPLVVSAMSVGTTYDDIVKQLKKICQPNIDLFRTFEPSLRMFSRGLSEYADLFGDHNLGREEKELELKRRLAALENTKLLDEFWKEFSLAVNIEEFMKNIGFRRSGIG